MTQADGVRVSAKCCFRDFPSGRWLGPHCRGHGVLSLAGELRPRRLPLRPRWGPRPAQDGLTDHSLAAGAVFRPQKCSRSACCDCPSRHGAQPALARCICTRCPRQFNLSAPECGPCTSGRPENRLEGQNLRRPSSPFNQNLWRGAQDSAVRAALRCLLGSLQGREAYGWASSSPGGHLNT